MPLLFTFMGQTGGILFPILSIEWHYRHVLRARIQTTYIDVYTIGIRAGYIKRFYPTGSAKGVLGDMAVKRVGTQVFFTA